MTKEIKKEDWEKQIIQLSKELVTSQNEIARLKDMFEKSTDFLIKRIVTEISKVKIEYPEYESDGYDSGCKRTLEVILNLSILKDYE